MAKSAATETVPEAIDFGVQGWKPEPGDTITGRITDLTTGGGEFGRYAIVMLTTKSGDDVAIHAFHHTLKTRLREMRPERGHTLTVTYHGMVNQTDRDGNVKMVDGEPKALALYTVDSPEFSFNWDAV